MGERPVGGDPRLLAALATTTPRNRIFPDGQITLDRFNDGFNFNFRSNKKKLAILLQMRVPAQLAKIHRPRFDLATHHKSTPVYMCNQNVFESLGLTTARL